MPKNESLQNDLEKNGVGNSRLIMTVAIVLPSIVTWVYFSLLSEHDPKFQQAAYSVGKAIQFLLPLFAVFLLNRESIKGSISRITASSGNTKAWWIGGIVFGLLVVAAMFVIYFLMLVDSAVGQRLVDKVRDKVSGMGLDSVTKFAALGVFYALVHSFLEEYYWRWFVFRYLKRSTSPLIANIISSLGFMAHHVLLLGFFLGWNEPLTYVFSLSIAIGGFAWAWIYDRTNSLLIPWISHLIVDAGIFSLGYFLIRDIF